MKSAWFTEDAVLPTPAGPLLIADAQAGDRVGTFSHLRRAVLAAAGALLAAFATAPAAEVLAAEVPEGAERLHLADAAFDEVRLLDPPRHAPLSEVEDAPAEPAPTGDAIGRVTNPLLRRAPALIEARIQGPAGEDRLYVTPEHPFGVPARQGLLPIGRIPIGTRLHVQAGGEALLVGKTWRYGDVEVFNIEVAGLHSTYVHGQGGGDGVWVHNACKQAAQAALARVGRVAAEMADDAARAAAEMADEAGTGRGASGGLYAADEVAEAAGRRFIVDPKGNALIEPLGGATVGNPAGTFVETRYPNGSPYQQLHGPHKTYPMPHGHGFGPGAGLNERGPSLDPLGNEVPYDSSAAHWPVRR